MPKIDVRHCIGCGVCEYVCPNDVWRIKGVKAQVTFPEDCIFPSCNRCAQLCPVQCISPELPPTRKELLFDFAWEERKRGLGLTK